jgi:hypothetical protein
VSYPRASRVLRVAPRSAPRGRDRIIAFRGLRGMRGWLGGDTGVRSLGGRRERSIGGEGNYGVITWKHELLAGLHAELCGDLFLAPG